MANTALVAEQEQCKDLPYIVIAGNGDILKPAITQVKTTAPGMLGAIH